jgi:hypothetical protein
MSSDRDTALDEKVETLVELASDGLMPHEQALALIQMYVNEVMSPVHRALWLAEKIDYINREMKKA